MSGLSTAPRYDQIDELTRGLELPLVALHEEHLTLIAEVIAEAFTELSLSQSAVLARGSEAEINALMETRLVRMLDEHPLWGQLVRAVARGKETVSFDGAHLEKRPDLSIYLTARSPSFPLVVECKLIDAKEGKSQALYCNNGLRRFLTGEYGWALRESFMLAYVRDQSTICSSLLPFLEASLNTKPELFDIQELPSASAHAKLDLARTAHGRGFRYPQREPPADVPGTISIWHLWLPTSATIARYSTAEVDQ